MAWTQFTVATFAQRITGPEFSALKNAAKGSGQTGDQLAEDCVSRVVDEVRGYVSGCKSNTLGPAGYIPSELFDAACALTVYRFITRLPNQTRLLDERRTKNYEDALTLLRSVQRCQFGIVPPETPSEQQAGGSGVTLINYRANIQTRADTAGLL